MMTRLDMGALDRQGHNTTLFFEYSLSNTPPDTREYRAIAVPTAHGHNSWLVHKFGIKRMHMDSAGQQRIGGVRKPSMIGTLLFQASTASLSSADCSCA